MDATRRVASGQCADPGVLRMSAEIIQFADVRVRRSSSKAIAPVQASEIEAGTRFHFWTGASGKRYVHTVYSLFDCPPIGVANYVLVKREASGKRSALSIGRIAHDAPSLNLAEIRQRGAELGANEVHIHLLAGSTKQSKLVEFDLKTGQVHAAQGGSRALH